ncbi:putative ribonuclease H-like domain-containing protein [Tanacetum coccineum]
METIHVKFDELVAMASECNNSGLGVNCLNFQDLSAEMNDILSQQDLDNLFDPLYEEYYAQRTQEVLDNSAANTLDTEDTPSSSSIIVDSDAPQIVTSSEEPIAQEYSTPVLDTYSDEQIQEDAAELDGNTIMHSFENLDFEEAESSLNYQDPSNMHENSEWDKLELLVLLKLLLLVIVSIAGKVQGKYSKWLILLVQKLRLLVEVTAAQEVQGKYTKCTEVIKQTYERLQKLICQLEMHGEVIPQEDINQKLLRSLSQEWTMHTIMWRNKPEIETLSLDDLFNNLKAYEPEVKETYSSTTNSHNVAFLSSSSILQCNYEQFNYRSGCTQNLRQQELGAFRRTYASWRENYPNALGVSVRICSNITIGVTKQKKIRNFMPPKPNLVYPSLDDFVDVNGSVSESIVEKPTVETNEPKTARKENRAPIIEDWVSKSKEQDEPKFQTVKPNFTKIEFVTPKTNRKSVEQIRQDTHSQSFSPSRSPKGNKRNWNQQMSQKLGSNFEIFNKACHVCGSFDHLKNDCNNWYNNQREQGIILIDQKQFLVLLGKQGRAVKASSVGRTRIVEENLHVQFSENTPNIAESGPNWLFDIDALTKSMNYKLVIIGNQSNCNAGTKACDDAGFSDAGLNFREDEKKVTKANQKRKLSNMPNQRFVYSDDDEDVGAEADMNNLDAFMLISPIPTTRIHKDHPIEQIIGDIHSAPQTRRMTKSLTEHEPEGNPSIKDPSWIKAMQDELLNKKDERGIMIKNKPRLVDQGYTQEEGINYDEVFSPVARIEAIRLFLAMPHIKTFGIPDGVKGCFFFMVGLKRKSMFVNHKFLKIQNFPDRVYKVEKALYGLHQAPRAWYETLSTYLLDNRFQRGKIDKTLFIKRDKGHILLVQVYVDDIIFGSTKKSL